MGTPEFAVASLKALVDSHCNIVAVVTVPDKPAGRGQQIQKSPVKIYAEENNIPVLQPEKLKDPQFIETLKKLNANLQIVVAFRMLPEIVWNMPSKGTFNLHASLLPQYRGAAPINHAIINGETETGITTFFLQHEIDTGKIIFREKIEIEETDNAGTLHDKLMELGAYLVVKTVLAIENNSIQSILQDDLLKENPIIKPAPKIFKENCKINWNKSASEIYNFIRGLSPYPAAWTELISEKNEITSMKIFECEISEEPSNGEAGMIISDNKNFIKVACFDKFVLLKSVQLAGKKRLNVEELLRGLRMENFKIKFSN
ncbi:MAG TPA: methionyl-tRNA formyltransferase [Bacteroidales bacterium]|nr:methionyl-tRNA formyltransferase [Bacteroidales bacterium]